MQIVHVVLRSRTNITPKRSLLKRRSSIRHVPRVLQGFISRMQQDALLRVHAPRLPGRRAKKMVVEYVRVVDKITRMRFHGTSRVGFRVGVLGDVEPV